MYSRTVIYCTELWEKAEHLSKGMKRKSGQGKGKKMKRQESDTIMVSKMMSKAILYVYAKCLHWLCTCSVWHHHVVV